MGIPVSKFIETVMIPLNEKWGYIWGTAGTKWTAAKQNDLEAKYESDPVKYCNYQMGAKYGKKWISRNVADCSGLVKWALVQNGSSCPHGSNSMWKGSLSEKGAIDKNTKIAPGEVVFKRKGSNDYYHVGVYIGDDKVVEAKSSYYGVVTSHISSWGFHGKLKAVDYDNSSTVPKEEFQLGDYKVVAENGKTVRIRKGPSKSANVVYDVPVGSDVKVLAEKDGWATIEYTVKGYMMTDYLKKD